MALAAGGRIRLETAIRQFAWRVGAFYGAQFLVYGATLPYLSVMLDSRGLTPAEIGLISAVPLVLRLALTPVVAMHADRRGSHRLIIIALSTVAFAATQAIVVARGFWPLLLSVAVFQVALQSLMPLVETIAMAGVRRWGHDYGRMRLCGSVTFILATFAGAWLIDWRGAEVIAWLLVTVTGATLAAALALPGVDLAAQGIARPRLRSNAAIELLASRPMLLFLLATGAVQSAHAVFYGFGVLHWRAYGIAPGWIGFLWSLGVVAEIALFWWSAQVMARFSPADMLRLGAAAAVVRWSLMAFDPPLAVLLALQVLHGLTYGASHLGAMHYIKASVPEAHAGTAQALYTTVCAGGMGAAMALAGIAYGHFAGKVYLAMALLGLVGLVAAHLLWRIEGRTEPGGR